MYQPTLRIPKSFIVTIEERRVSLSLKHSCGEIIWQQFLDFTVGNFQQNFWYSTRFFYHDCVDPSRKNGVLLIDRNNEFFLALGCSLFSIRGCSISFKWDVFYKYYGAFSRLSICLCLWGFDGHGYRLLTQDIGPLESTSRATPHQK